MSYKNSSRLKELYLDKKLSISEIANLFDVNPRTIWYWLIKHKIPRREPSNVKIGKLRITKEELKNLYLNDGLSAAEIGKKFGIKSTSNILIRLHKYGIPPRDRYDAVSKSNTRYPKKSFSKNLKEKAYLMGLRMGDLEAKKEHRIVRVRVCSSKDSQIALFKDVFERYVKVISYPVTLRGKKEITAYAHLDSTFNFLIEKPVKIPEWIISNNGNFYSFLAGYADSEASWKIIKSHKNAVNFIFYLATEDKEILEQLKEKLIELGFVVHLYLEKKKGTKTNLGVYKKDLYALNIEKKAHVVRLAEILLPLSKHEDKIKRMKLILEIKDKKWDQISKI
ncbi:MAG: LAGLIDADG family homing endonuclease [Candidatus Aenigmarchaeota archaeon]|nr:LAGLIDADG family homing endonuclease [Candidatus Aenigmarchaeota archaeon]